MVMRTICLPIAECLSHSKSDLYQAIRKSLDASRTVANAAATECLRQDKITEDKCCRLYTYPACKSLYSGASFMVSSICRSVEKSYKQDRWQVKHGIKSSRSYRSIPWPMLCNAGCQSFRLIDEEEFLVAEIKLLDGVYRVRLAGGTNYRDQLRGLRSAMSTDAVCDSKLWLDRSHRAILGISVDLPAKSAQERSGSVQVVSGIDYLIAITMPRSQKPFALNGDEIQAWKAESIRKNQRWRQARKQGVNKERLREMSRSFAKKMQRRLKTKTHEIAAQVIAKANQCSAAIIELDLTIKSFLPSFPWHDLACKIKHKAAMNGMQVIENTQAIVEPDLDQPHVYFLYDPHAERIKIGKTKGKAGRLEAYLTINPDCVVLAIDNQPIAKLGAKEKHYHAMFDNHRVTKRNKAGNELFVAGPVLEWLRAVGWLGNAGNLSQITQVLDVSHDTTRDGRLRADGEGADHNEELHLSQNATKSQGYLGLKPMAPEVRIST